jgi:hypothetical protein
VPAAVSPFRRFAVYACRRRLSSCILPLGIPRRCVAPFSRRRSGRAPLRVETHVSRTECDPGREFGRGAMRPRRGREGGRRRGGERTREGSRRRARCRARTSALWPRARPRSPWPTDLYCTRGIQVPHILESRAARGERYSGRAKSERARATAYLARTLGHPLVLWLRCALSVRVRVRVTVVFGRLRLGPRLRAARGPTNQRRAWCVSARAYVRAYAYCRRVRARVSVRKKSRGGYAIAVGRSTDDDSSSLARRCAETRSAKYVAGIA